ncbi:MAG: hypothetical protein K5875_00285 [Saccharofermentans sp.]|nr:hypothetical protein [Saccharofermentans sp.]
MKKTAVRIIAAVMVCAMLSACRKDVGGLLPEHDELEDATKVEQILERLTWCNDLDLMTYSELENYDEYLGYFDLLQTYDFNYLLLNIDGGQYIFMMYRFTETTEQLDALKNVRKNYTGDKLNLSFETESHKVFEDSGCFPQAVHVRCILKVDDGFDPDKCTVYAEGYGAPVIEKYQGGVIRVDGKYGFVDEDLNIKQPVVHGNINDFETDRVDGYYWMVDDGTMALLDHGGNIVLSQSYTSIICINPDRFLVTKMDENGFCTTGIVDGHENVVCDFISGSVEMQSIGIYNAKGQYILSSGGLKGVIDEDLNVIIEPKYSEVVEYCGESPNMFYVVENGIGKCAVVDNKGEFQTGFDYDEWYDAYKDYFDSKGGYSSDYFGKGE